MYPTERGDTSQTIITRQIVSSRRPSEKKYNQRSGEKQFHFQQIKKGHKQQLLMNLSHAHPELFHLTSTQNINFAYHQQLLMNLNQVLRDLKDHV
jgi:hypothetical protein